MASGESLFNFQILQKKAHTGPPFQTFQELNTPHPFDKLQLCANNSPPAWPRRNSHRAGYIGNGRTQS
jgi:hypothetical protein